MAIIKHTSKKNNTRAKHSKKMTKEEAGHIEGSAHHRCRRKGSFTKSSSKTDKSESSWFDW